jgi:eukaryotic-like serine/threonine-protein kinase
MSSRPEAQRALVRAAGSSSDDDAERFYALRVSDYAFVLTLIFGGVYIAGFLFILVKLPGQLLAVHVHPAKLANLVFGLASLFVWRLARRPNAPSWLVTISDLFLPVGVSTVVCLVAVTVPPWSGLYIVPLLIAALLLVLRAALLPSPPRRTALVGVLSSLPVVIAARILSTHDDLPSPVSPDVVMMGAAIWCAALIGSTVVVSRVIYGLQNEIRSVRRLGQYVLGELIGEGGMGAVYRAEHAMLRRPTAVKMLLPDRAGPDSIVRFEREVKLTARLTHPNTVAIYDYGRTRDGLFYYAMEFLDGLSLEELVRRFGPQSPSRVIHVLMQAAGALAEAHALGLIHRDIKPANVLFCERGGVPDTVKLVDFGLVKNLEPEDGPALTQTNAITGTPQYLAPESIINPSSVDHRVDLYGLGGVAYYLLTGRPPFEGQSVLEICGHHLHTPPTPPSDVIRSPVPPDLEALVLKLLAKKPEDRPSGAQALYDELVECARTTPWNVAEARSFWLEFRKGSEPPASERQPAEA